MVFVANTLQHPRLGLAVAKRQAKLAVERNRVKRNLRESFRDHAAGLPAVDCVVYLNAASVSHGNRDLRRAIDALWRKVKDKCSAPSSP